MKISFDDMLAQQQAKKPVARGKYAKLINSMPAVLSEHVVVSCWTSKELMDVRKAIKKYRGDQFTGKVVTSLVHGISKWGIELWSDRHFFTPKVFENMDSLEEKDRRFIEIIAGTTLTNFLQAAEKKND